MPCAGSRPRQSWAAPGESSSRTGWWRWGCRSTSGQTLRKAAAALDDGQLQAWKAALDKRAAERYGGGPQLVRTQGSGKDDEAYLI